MKKTLSILMSVVLSLALLPFAFAVDTNIGIGVDITPEEFPPHIWLCDSRVVVEDCVESGRKTDCSDELTERIQNYAFEGEQIEWKVLVMDKNKIEQIEDVVGTVGTTQGELNPVEVECGRIDNPYSTIPDKCEARILEESLSGTAFDPDTQAFYKCVLTVETQASMYGDSWITIEAIASDGQSATIDENEFWFLNPNIALTTSGNLVFSDVRPGSVAYSDTVLVGNDADLGSGVLLDMFISGTDFYDPSSSGAKCPVSNRLKLSQDLRSQASLGAGVNSGATQNTACNAGVGGLSGVDNNDHLCYYATNGAYSTFGAANADAEGYRPIVYSDQFTRDFYNDAEIIFNGGLTGGYSLGNVLAPGAEIAMTFKLGLPEPCIGDFSDGDIYFWGEAI
jgi:hypothetical protein